MARVVLRPGLDTLVEDTIGVDVALNEMADAIAERARNIAPVDTGAFRDSIFADGNRVFADIDYARFLEFGTWKTPTFATLRRAASEMGLKRTRVN